MKSLNDFCVLISRNFRVFVSDRANCRWAFLQVPLIAGLMVIAFWGFESDERVADYFVRFATHAHQYFVERNSGGGAAELRNSTAWKLHEQTQKDAFQISAANAQRRCGLYFVMVSAAIWFSIMAASREIVNEQHVLFRELRCCFGVLPYLAAKFVVLTWIVGLQTFLLMALVAPWMLSLMIPVCLMLWGTLWLTAMAAVSLGLLLSAASPSNRVALTLVPLLMLPQLLFGGLLRPGPSTLEESPPPIIGSKAPTPPRHTFQTMNMVLRSMAIQRWGFEAALALDRYATNGILTLTLSWPDADPDRMLQPDEWMRGINTREYSLVDLVFNNSDNSPSPSAGRQKQPRQGCQATRPAIILLAMVFVFLAGCYGTLRMRFL
jgi:type IV secretory pathway TrbD component